MSEINESPNIYPKSDYASENVTSVFSNKNYIIIFLLILLIFSLIGINLLTLSGAIFSEIVDPISPILRNVLAMVGFTTGTILNNSADIVANTADFGIDIAKGTTHSIGDLLINSSNPGIDNSRQMSLSEVIGIPNLINPTTNPKPIQSSDSTVTPISTQKSKAGWCYVGDDSGKRGCVEMTEHDKCMSGQIFVAKSECLNPKK